MLPVSILTRNQKKIYSSKKINDRETLTVKIRYNDDCNNGHNSFAITGEIRDSRRIRDNGIVACGCLHDEIQQHFPELTKYIKFHLCSSDGPLYYIANTMYWIEKGNLEYARSCAIWPDMPESYMTLDPNVIKGLLEERLPALMEEFKQCVEELGFIY